MINILEYIITIYLASSALDAAREVGSFFVVKFPINIKII
jgi:hypothetical protein